MPAAPDPAMPGLCQAFLRGGLDQDAAAYRVLVDAAGGLSIADFCGDVVPTPAGPATPSRPTRPAVPTPTHPTPTHPTPATPTRPGRADADAPRRSPADATGRHDGDATRAPTRATPGRTSDPTPRRGAPRDRSATAGT